MKIKIEEDGRRITIPLPIGIVLNRITVRILADCLKRYAQFSLTQVQLNALCCELKRAKKTLANLPLVDIVSNDGKKLKITL